MTWPTEPMAREYYAPIDIENGPILHYREFREVYAEAVQNNSPWLLNPVDVAFRFKGVLDETGNYPDGYYSPDLVMAFTTADDHVTVVIISENAPDDSIKDQEVRVDLVSENGIWRVEWAGYRQRCYRNNYDGWITGRCP
ncbi:MAG TPA: hypothetical protein PK454_09700 [Anaerolineaceae bacterium]|nr:hypothetical protein [Anaerolineaceae bacterium]HOG80014.1 hypothetical protein [Anaerolineaceae bacterium]